MEVSHTKKSTRIIIWIIAIVMALGFLGSYFLVILENENSKNAQLDQLNASQNNPENQQEAPVDPTAYKVEGKVEKLEVTDLVTGNGDEVKAGDTVKVHYKGTIASTGGKFDSSYDRGEPIEIPLGDVIVGWQEGVPGMKVGGKRRLVIPSEQGYGAQPQAGIPANSDLVFEIELIAVTPKAQ